MIYTPPQHGKSTLVSHYFPAWYLGKRPTSRVLLASYEASFAAHWGGRARDTMAEYGAELFGTGVSTTRGAQAWWETDQGGYMATAGVGGPITGKGARLAIIDDPVKNQEEALSQTYRDKTWEWYRATFRTRVEQGGAIVLVMTRWHEDDLAGRLLRYEPERWTVVRLPAIAEQDDPMGRAEGEPLAPQLFGRETLLETKAAVGSFWWSALYQQRPSPATGGIFRRDWWRYYREAPAVFDEVVASWDMSFRETRQGSFVVGQVWGRRGADKYLLDQVRDRMGFPATIEAVRQLAAKWPQARTTLIEDKANGPAVIDTLRGTIGGIVPVTPEGSKAARAHAVSPQVEAGNVWLPDPEIAPWIGDYIEELTSFPVGANDDQVDATTQALDRLGGHSVMTDTQRNLLRGVTMVG